MYTVETPDVSAPHLLFLTQVLPYPLDSGAKVRAYYMLRHLSQTHRITLVSFVRPDDSQQAADHLRTFCQAVHCVPMRRSLWRNVRAGVRGLLTRLPIVIVRDEIRQMYDLLSHLLRTQRYDLVHADQTSMAGYGLWAAARANTGKPRTLLDQHNAMYQLTLRMAVEATDKPSSVRSLVRGLILYREYRAFLRYERGLCRAYDAVLTVTPQDKAHFLALFSEKERQNMEAKIFHVPIAVDPQTVQPVPRSEEYPWSTHHPPTILHVGTMFWPPNVAGVLWFAHHVLPRIWDTIPNARFVVVGKNPPPEICTLAVDPRIQVMGYVEDVRPTVETADVFVVPVLSGGGMRVKILDGWLWGLPIVSTSVGAEGIEVRPVSNILLADDPLAFAGAVTRLLTEPILNRHLRQTGRSWVESRYAWPIVYAQVSDIYSRLLTFPS